MGACRVDSRVAESGRSHLPGKECVVPSTSSKCHQAYVPSLRAVHFLMVVMLATGCATTGVSSVGPIEGPLPPGVDHDVLEGGAVAEATLALSRIWSVAGGVQQVGSRLSFSFWSERGALTLTEYAATGRDGPLGLPVNEDSFQEEIAQVLTDFAQRHTGLVHLTLERQQTRWTVSFSTSARLRPPEAKTLPVRRAGLPPAEVLALSQGVRQVLRGIKVPTGTQTRLEVELVLEDGRVEDCRLRLFQSTRAYTGGSALPLDPAVMEEVVAVLLPFTQGVGPRVVRVDLRLALSPGARQAHGWVEQAFVERPSFPAELNAEFVTEYRAMHEDILRRWREESREAGEWVARQGAEELVVWYVGGIAVRGLGWLGAKVAPTVLRVLRRSGEAAAGWLRTTLIRLSPEKRQAFERLWTKVQLEGSKSLSTTERDELRGVMESMERLIHTPLDDRAKKRLRDRAREVYKRVHPEVARVLDEKGAELPIHHRYPL